MLEEPQDYISRIPFDFNFAQSLKLLRILEKSQTIDIFGSESQTIDIVCSESQTIDIFT